MWMGRGERDRQTVRFVQVVPARARADENDGDRTPPLMPKKPAHEVEPLDVRQIEIADQSGGDGHSVESSAQRSGIGERERFVPDESQDALVVARFRVAALHQND
jgi:hypothetical protein